jgi:hypothetical protein
MLYSVESLVLKKQGGLNRRLTVRIKIMTVLLLALLSYEVGAIQMSGNSKITMSGGLKLNGPIDSATQVTEWVDPEVVSVSGDFTATVGVGDPVVLTAPWVIGSPLNVLYMVDGWTFRLVTTTIQSQNSNFLNISGAGFISGNGFEETPGIFNLAVPSPSDDDSSIFSFAAASGPARGPNETPVPDVGTTISLLSVGALGLTFMARGKK